MKEMIIVQNKQGQICQLYHQTGAQTHKFSQMTSFWADNWEKVSLEVFEWQSTVKQVCSFQQRSSKNMVKQQKIINQLIKQVKIQAFLDHSHIIKLYGIFDDKENIYLLCQFCCDGNLYEYMNKKGKIDEAEASQFMRETCQAVKQLHFHKIIHRDIKPENIVMSFGMVKVCDFGWSTQIKGEFRNTFCGSPLYISPELLKGNLYDEKVDLWALGILGDEMMTGKIPFDIRSEKDFVKIITSEINYPTKMSPFAVSFLKQILSKNPNDRSTIQNLLEHPFLSKK